MSEATCDALHIYSNQTDILLSPTVSMLKDDATRRFLSAQRMLSLLSFSFDNWHAVCVSIGTYILTQIPCVLPPHKIYHKRTHRKVILSRLSLYLFHIIIIIRDHEIRNKIMWHRNHSFLIHGGIANEGRPFYT